jgi:hypothetical protein
MRAITELHKQNDAQEVLNKYPALPQSVSTAVPILAPKAWTAEACSHKTGKVRRM